ncbi:pyridoxal phosphate homeostasis protein [Trichonephila inaurata madagascariensis]|uniref:Pyridoxal phosphate homeostasis protein n=1 Tax=Trichonephila inaurata madagascariensis TaxID=2747483 RepID=A0A8X6XG26_9ARAC|nr:pyridoxal phosphate homeostasis protein [Trichonephila inaurata madagascariensis]
MSEPQISIRKKLEEVRNEMATAISRRPQVMDFDVTLVAVSKRMPNDSIIEAYDCGVRDFGENYLQEIVDKSNDPEIMKLCPEIKWHFIGHLQSNKVTKLINACPNLHMIHGVDSKKVAEAIERSFCRKPSKEAEGCLYVFIQVNTSGEESKSGIPIEDVEDFYLFIKENCPHLVLEGLMTIGSPNHDLTKGPNPDFIALIELKKKIKDKYSENLNLSMGMSQDFQHAIELGSTYVRIGEKIFGKRK